MIVAIGGRPQSGKSKLAGHLAVALDGVLLDLAQLRTALFPTALTASREQAARLYEWLLQAAVWNLHQRPAAPVVLDAHPLTHARDVRALRHLAAGIGHRLHVIECVRAAHQADHEPPGDTHSAVLDPKIVVDTRKPLADCITEILHDLARSPATERVSHVPPFPAAEPIRHGSHLPLLATRRTE
ncbi:AAA family ATPase [Streptomyces sp. NPDC012637]|uniref:AAA family ATPase n=1 Tax=Streptomyces sp. NPDC012637 TaxID=3364842 RepID=UPI0036ED0C8C